ncbi:MAG: hypothetical protein E7337_06720 [Clostridiales bacterium]|nr:hypothetical protein [Clostridiales bacterium]
MKHMERALAMLLALVMMVPAVAFAQEEVVETEAAAAFVDEAVEEMGEVSLGDFMEMTEEEPAEEAPADEEPAEKVIADEEIIIENFVFPGEIVRPEVYLNAESECAHEDVRIYATFGNGNLKDIKKYEYCDKATHWAIGDIYRHTECEECGAALEKVLLVKNGRALCDHNLNSKKVCHNCKVKVVEKISADVRREYVPYEEMYEAINDGDAETHLWKGNLVDRTYYKSDAYGDYFEYYDDEEDVIIEKDVEWREPHDVYDNICMYCGYEPEEKCAHTNVELVSEYLDWPLCKDTGDDFTHLYYDEWWEYAICQDCGTEVGFDPVTFEELGIAHPVENGFPMPHNYIKGRCSICGHKTGFTISAKSLKLGIGEKWILGYEFPAEENACKVTFSSSNSKIAKVDKVTGEITPKKTGSVNITVKAENGKKLTCKVKVYKKPTSIKLNTKAIVLGVGESYKLTTKLSSKSYSHITWTVDPENPIVSVDEAGNVTANAVGTTTVTAATYNGKHAECTVTVKDAPADANIAIAVDKAVIGVKEKIKAYAALSENCAGKITFSADNDAIKIDAVTGAITAVKAGTVTVKAEAYNGASASVDIEVKPAPSKIRITNAPKKLGVGQKYTLDVKIGADDEDCAGSWTFASSNRKIATVNKYTGEITAKKNGTVKITVTSHHSKKIKHTVTIKVYKKPTKAKLSKTYLEMIIGKTYDLNVKFSSGTYSPVTWASDSDCVTVDENGLITAVKAGSANVTATLYNKTLTCEVKVGYAPDRMAFMDNGYEIYGQTVHIGEKRTIKPTLFSEFGPAYATVTYTSDNPKVATVNKYTGEVCGKALSYGRPVNITATTDTGLSLSYMLYVYPAPEAVEIWMDDTIPAGIMYGVSTYEDEVYYNDIRSYCWLIPEKLGDAQYLDCTVKSSNPAVADIVYLESENKLMLQTYKPGTFTLTVKLYNGKKDSKKITVVPNEG